MKKKKRRKKLLKKVKKKGRKLKTGQGPLVLSLPG